jgi:hypothetical protein
VFHYEHQTGAHSLAAIAGEWLTRMATVIRALYEGEVTLVELVLKNLFDSSDTLAYPIGLTGTAGPTANQLPTQCSVGVQMLHNNPDVRKGWKRFWPINYLGATDGVLTGASVTKYTAVGDALIDGLFVNANPPYDSDLPYIILKRIAYEEDGKTKYRLPENLAESVWGVVDDYDINLRVTTQNTRKQPSI